MPQFTVRVPSIRPVGRTFAYMADLRNFERWDPGVRAAWLVVGESPGLDAAFDVTVGGVLRDVVLRYETLEYEAPHRVVVRARNSVLTSVDEIAVEEAPAGSVVAYQAGLEFHGPLRVLNPLLAPVFKRIVDRAAAGLRDTLAREES